MTLNLILAGAGVAMIASYLSARADAEEKSRAVEPRADIQPVPTAPEREAAAPATVASASDRVLAASIGGKVAPAADAESDRDSPGKSTSKAADSAPDKPDATRSGGGAGLDDEANQLGLADPKLDVGAGKPTEQKPEVDERSEMRALRARVDALAGRHQRQLHGCYRSALSTKSPGVESGQALEGRVDIRFTIMPDGSAKSVKPVANTSGSPELARCLVGVVRRWAFPSGSSKPHDFIWPFRFRAASPAN